VTKDMIWGSKQFRILCEMENWEEEGRTEIGIEIFWVLL